MEFLKFTITVLLSIILSSCGLNDEVKRENPFDRGGVPPSLSGRLDGGTILLNWNSMDGFVDSYVLEVELNGSQINRLDIPKSVWRYRYTESIEKGHRVEFRLAGRRGAVLTPFSTAVEIVAENRIRGCNDDNPCTKDDYDSEADRCVNNPVNVPCDDGNLCTQDDRCINGVCSGNSVADGSACGDDDNPCTVDRCLGGVCISDASWTDGKVCGESTPGSCTMQVCQSGSCLERAVDEGAMCNDGNPDTLNDFCKGGTCTGCGKSNNPCIAPMFDPKTGECGKPIINRPCDDGNPCTVNDICRDKGVCRGDGSQMDNTPCNDSNDCTFNDRCMNGKCTGKNVAAETDCFHPDADPCTVFECDGKGVCKGEQKAEGESCKPENVSLRPGYRSCAVFQCSSKGECEEIPLSKGTSCGPTTQCQTKSCDGEGACIPEMFDKGCYDEKGSTWGDHCNGGECEGKQSSDPCAVYEYSFDEEAYFTVDIGRFCEGPEGSKGYNFRCDGNGSCRFYCPERCSFPDKRGNCTKVGEFNPSNGQCEKIVGGSRMVYIPGGLFQMGEVGYQGGTFSTRFRKVMLTEGFYMDMFEVSVKDFRLFMDYVTSKGLQCGRDGLGGKEKCWDSISDAEDNYPVSNVTWYGALSYCRWKGKELPDDVRWELAARGKDGKEFPWKPGLPINDVANCSEMSCGDGYPGKAPCDSFPAGVSPYGLYNMAGNVAEWVQRNLFVKGGSDDELWIDPPNESVKWTGFTDSARPLRGGAYISGNDRLRTFSTLLLSAGLTEDYIGFRCMSILEISK